MLWASGDSGGLEVAGWCPDAHLSWLSWYTTQAPFMIDTPTEVVIQCYTPTSNQEAGKNIAITCNVPMIHHCTPRYDSVSVLSRQDTPQRKDTPQRYVTVWWAPQRLGWNMLKWWRDAEFTLDDEHPFCTWCWVDCTLFRIHVTSWEMTNCLVVSKNIGAPLSGMV